MVFDLVKLATIYNMEPELLGRYLYNFFVERWFIFVPEKHRKYFLWILRYLLWEYYSKELNDKKHISIRKILVLYTLVYTHTFFYFVDSYGILAAISFIHNYLIYIQYDMSKIYSKLPIPKIMNNWVVQYVIEKIVRFINFENEFARIAMESFFEMFFTIFKSSIEKVAPGLIDKIMSNPSKPLSDSALLKPLDTVLKSLMFFTDYLFKSSIDLFLIIDHRINLLPQPIIYRGFYATTAVFAIFAIFVTFFLKIYMEVLYWFWGHFAKLVNSRHKHSTFHYSTITNFLMVLIFNVQFSFSLKIVESNVGHLLNNISMVLSWILPWINHDSINQFFNYSYTLYSGYITICYLHAERRILFKTLFVISSHIWKNIEQVKNEYDRTGALLDKFWWMPSPMISTIIDSICETTRIEKICETTRPCFQIPKNFKYLELVRVKISKNRYFLTLFKDLLAYKYLKNLGGGNIKLTVYADQIVSKYLNSIHKKILKDSQVSLDLPAGMDQRDLKLCMAHGINLYTSSPHSNLNIDIPAKNRSKINSKKYYLLMLENTIIALLYLLEVLDYKNHQQGLNVELFSKFIDGYIITPIIPRQHIKAVAHALLRKLVCNPIGRYLILLTEQGTGPNSEINLKSTRLNWAQINNIEVESDDFHAYIAQTYRYCTLFSNMNMSIKYKFNFKNRNKVMIGKLELDSESI